MTDCAEKPSVLCQYSNEYTRHGECYNDATPSVLCQYSNEYMCHGECYNDATRYELFFDSPGLARNEPTLGTRSQGDSTPSVLSFFYEGMLTMKHFMAD